MATTLRPYGRLEIKNLRQKYLMDALIVSIGIHLAIAGSYYLKEYYNSTGDEERVLRTRIVKYSDLGPPPSIMSSPPAPTVGVTMRAARPTIGIPVPVPDIEINPEQTFATQKELSASNGPYGEGGNGAGNAGIADNTTGSATARNDITIEEDEPGMNEFIPIEKPPQIIKSVSPEYPDIARRSGVESVVWVNVLIDKTGKPKKAVVIKEEVNGMFNQAAIDAAMQYLFTPAVMNNGPVQVWVSLKFRFQLKDKQS